VVRRLSSKSCFGDADASTDPKYEDEVSGCTATTCIITHDKIYVVRVIFDGIKSMLILLGKLWRLEDSPWYQRPCKAFVL